MENGFEAAERQFTQVVEKYKAPSSLWLETIESELGPDGRELTRQILQGHLNSRGHGDIGSTLVTSDGVVLTHRRLIKKSLQTMFGEICIERIGYSLRDHPNVFPLDAALNLPSSSFSAGLQRFIARRVPMTPFTEVLDLVREVAGVVISKGLAIKIVQRCATDFDAFYAAMEKQGNRREPVLVLTTDGKGVVMRPEGLRKETQERAKNAVPTMKTRLAPGEKSNRKRMAQVASVYVIKKFIRVPRDIIDELARKGAAIRRPRPSQKRVWASIEKDTDVVIKAMFAEANKRDPRHKKQWVVLVDGNKHQLRLVNSLAKKEGVDATVILDIVHVIEYLWDAARLFNAENDHTGCERWVNEQLSRVLNGQAGKVAGTIRIKASKKKLGKSEAKTAKDSARYIARHKSYMKYKTYLKRGFPIATGVIEGACRHLIKDRMDVTGARWSLNGAEAVLKLRSIVSSGDFDRYWIFHRRQEYTRNHISKIGDLDQLKSLQPSK